MIFLIIIITIFIIIIDVPIISNFAKFEFRYGDIEHGPTMFDSLLSSYHHRVDLWCVYLDMMI